MMTGRRLGGFVGLLLLYYIGLAVIPRPVFRQSYARGFRAATGALFGYFPPNGLTRFEAPDIATTIQDSAVRFKNRRTGMVSPPIGFSAWLMGYLPLAALVALTLATPVPWSRRWKALGWGVLWIHVFVLLRVFTLVLFGFCGPPPVGLFYPGPFWAQVIEITSNIIGVSPVTTFVVPILIWIVVCFRREDWESILAPGSTDTARP
jgi:hypothetical protein